MGKGRQVARKIQKVIGAVGGKDMAKKFSTLRSYASNIHTGSKTMLRVLKNGVPPQVVQNLKSLARKKINSMIPRNKEQAKNLAKQLGKTAVKAVLAGGSIMI